jgi:hypothetical protein
LAHRVHLPVLAPGTGRGVRLLSLCHRSNVVRAVSCLPAAPAPKTNKLTSCTYPAPAYLRVAPKKR